MRWPECRHSGTPADNHVHLDRLGISNFHEIVPGHRIWPFRPVRLGDRKADWLGVRNRSAVGSERYAGNFIPACNAHGYDDGVGMFLTPLESKCVAPSRRTAAGADRGLAHDLGVVKFVCADRQRRRKGIAHASAGRQERDWNGELEQSESGLS